MQSPFRARWRAVALWASLVAFAAALTFQRIRSFDYWWHLRTGALIAETGAVPKVDPFSYTVPGARWIDIHWLHQLGLHALHSVGGHAAVSVGKFILVVLLLAILARIGYRRQRPLVTVAGLTLVLLAAADRFMPRPELPSFVLLAAVLALFDRYARRPDRWIYAVVPIQALWVNIHGLFALGVVVCAIHLASEVLHPLLVPGERLRAQRLKTLGLVTGFALLASLANPNFLEGALYPVQQLGMIGPTDDRGFFGSTIVELYPTLGGAQPASPFMTSVFLGLAALTFAAMAANWRRLAASDPLLWVAFGYLALGAQRNLALFGLVAAPILVRNANELLDRFGTPRAVWSGVSALYACGLLVLCVDTATGRFFPRIGSSREPGMGPMEIFYPVGAADWIERVRPRGPIAHHMADGGYLIWRLYPDYPVMVDGRLEVYGPEKYAQLQFASIDRWRELDAEYHFGVILVHFSLVHSDNLLRWLDLNPRWRLAFVDDVAAVFVRSREDGSFDVPALDLAQPGAFPPFDALPSQGDMMRRAARTRFYGAMHHYDRALALWRETIELYPDMPNRDIVHASLLRKSGLGAAAEAILKKLLEEHPDDSSLRLHVGDLRFEDGDLAEARAHYDAALARDPNLPEALQRRAAVAEKQGDLEEAIGIYVRVLTRLPPFHPVAIAAATRMRALGAGGPVDPGY